MGKLFYILIILILFSCKIKEQSKEFQCSRFTRCLKIALKNSFFDNYRTDNKIFLLARTKYLYNQINQCKDSNYLVDTLKGDYHKFVYIDSYGDYPNGLMFQITCVDLDKNTSIMYSTAYIIDKRGKASIAKKCPSIDDLLPEVNEYYK